MIEKNLDVIIASMSNGIGLVGKHPQALPASLHWNIYEHTAIITLGLI